MSILRDAEAEHHARIAYQNAAVAHSEAVLDAMLAGDMEWADQQAEWSVLCQLEADYRYEPVIGRRLRRYVGP